jgi:hypothetical protein
MDYQKTPSTDDMIFVFGSNLSGIHGAGAARYAHEHKGAPMGHGVGQWGNSYALPTKGRDITFMPLSEVSDYVDDFIKYASDNPHLTFQITQVGCGLAGFKSEQIAPLFCTCPANCWFDTAWKPWLPSSANFWGTFG